MNMFTNRDSTSGQMIPWQDWTGFQRDVIDQVATAAGFTYTLHPPSGDGPNCARNANGSKNAPHSYAGAYLCGEQDVTNLTRTHVYWGQFYITPNRLRTSLMTVPVLSDVGLTMVMKPEQASIWDTMWVILMPFTPFTWVFFGGLIVVFALVMWAFDHSGPGGDRVRRARIEDKLPNFYGLKGEHGYFKSSNFMAQMPAYSMKALHTAFGNVSAYQPQNASSSALNVSFAFFMFLFFTTYSAKLTANLTTLQLRHPVSGIGDVPDRQARGVMGNVCSQDGAAYTIWLEENMPGLQMTKGTTTEDMLAELEQGKCEALIVILPAARAITSDSKYSHLRLSVVGEPLQYGNTDFAVGVRKDLPGVQIALSYWIQELRACTEFVRPPKGKCHLSKNIYTIYEDWHPLGSSDGGGSDRLGFDVFLWPLIIIVVITLYACVREVGHPRLRDRLIAVFFGDGLWACAHSHPFVKPGSMSRMGSTWLSRKFDREHVLDVFKQLATTKGSANDDYKRIIRCLRCYLVGPDFQAWQLLVATTDQLDKEILASPLSTFLHRPSTPSRPLTPGRETAASIIAMHWRSKRNDNSRVWQLVSLQAKMLAAALHSLELEEKGLARFSRGFSRRRSSGLQAGADAPAADADAPAADEWTEEEDAAA